MTLEEFRRNWIRDHVEAGPAPAGSTTRRLTFVAPKETELVPRLVFREVFSAPPVERRPRARARPWGALIVWTAAGFIATAAVGVGMSKIFSYAPTYMEKYISPQR